MIGEFSPTRVSWLALSDTGVDAVFMSVDYPTEGVVGSIVFGVQGDTLRTLFQDGDRVCAATSLTDLDGNGKLELLTHEEPGLSPDCTNPCRLALHMDTRATPGWPVIREWDRQEWKASKSAQFKAVFRVERERYLAAARWIDTSHAAKYCEKEWGSAEFFSNAAKKALRIADSTAH